MKKIRIAAEAPTTAPRRLLGLIVPTGNDVIVSRHPAAIEFLRREGRLPADTPVFSGNVTPDDVRGRVVWGNVPMHIAVHARVVKTIEFPGQPPRGQDYSLEEMDAAGASIGTYMVSEVRH